MAFTLKQHAEGALIAPETTADDSAFQVSSDPVISAAKPTTGITEAGAVELPKSYGGAPALYLMPRDPETLFVYWDVDWRAALHDEMPRHRKVLLRILKSDGSEEIAQEIEPMAGSCYVTVSSADEIHTGDLGFYGPARAWNSVAISAAVQMPRDSQGAAEAADFATVPFHLSFQRMIDAFRVSHHESASLTGMLSELRERANSSDEAASLTSEEREIVCVLETAAPAPTQKATVETSSPAPRDLWARVGIDRVLGFGAASPASGFGGSSRAL